MNAITMMPVESSQMAEIGHDPGTNTLAIRFKGYGGKVGSLYHYQGFDAEQFKAFLEAESKGRFFGQNIKNVADKYPYTRQVEKDKD